MLNYLMIQILQFWNEKHYLNIKKRYKNQRNIKWDNEENEKKFK